MPVELKRSLKTNERVPAFLARLEREASVLPKSIATKENVIAVVTDMTTLFLNALMKKADEQAMSDLEKSRLRAQREKLARLDEAADTGILTEQVIDDLKN